MNISNSKVFLNQENKDRGLAGVRLKLGIFGLGLALVLAGRMFSHMNHSPEDAKAIHSSESGFCF